MKAPATIETAASAPGTGVPIVAASGALLKRKNTVRAEVLRTLLTGGRMTGMSGVFDASTTRLSAVVHALTEDYGWTIERTDKVVGCKDGRVQTVAEYHLLPSIIAEAMRNGAAAWCNEVRVARAARRAKAADARRMAIQANTARSQRNSAPPSAQIEMVYG